MISAPEGRALSFRPTADGAYTPMTPRSFDSLTRNADGSFSLVRRNRTRLTWEPVDASTGNARLASIVDRNGNMQTLTYDAEGRLRSIAQGTFFAVFEYDDSNRVSAISDHTGRTWRYSYDAAGDLNAIVDPLGFVTQYGYDAKHLLTAIVDARGTTLHSPMRLTTKAGWRLRLARWDTLRHLRITHLRVE